MTMKIKVRTGLGQDSHRFESVLGKPLMLGGVLFVGEPGLEGNSDADVILHALANAISGVTGVNVMGAKSDLMCRDGVGDSAEYVKEAMKSLGPLQISHVSISMEGARPRFSTKTEEICERIAEILGVSIADVTLTATSGEALTAFGKGEGLQALVILTAVEG